MAFLAGLAGSSILPLLAGVAGGVATSLISRPRIPPAPKPKPPPRQPIRISDTTARQRGRLAQRTRGGATGVNVGLLSGGGEGAIARPALLGR